MNLPTYTMKEKEKRQSSKRIEIAYEACVYYLSGDIYHVYVYSGVTGTTEWGLPQHQRKGGCYDITKKVNKSIKGHMHHFPLPT